MDTSVKRTPELDSLKLKSETLYTKRELASLAAKIFDAIGLISIAFYSKVKTFASESVDPGCWLG